MQLYEAAHRWSQLNARWFDSTTDASPGGDRTLFNAMLTAEEPLLDSAELLLEHYRAARHSCPSCDGVAAAARRLIRANERFCALFDDDDDSAPSKAREKARDKAQGALAEAQHDLADLMLIYGARAVAATFEDTEAGHALH
jgi:hypothetical protein